MDKVSRKPRLNIIDTESLNMDSFSKWMPFICAGSAIGLSIFVLRELKKTKDEMHTLTKANSNDPGVSKKLSELEKQLNTISEYIKNTKSRKSPIIKKAVVIDPEPTIINEATDSEYEEIEVTDDEED